MTHNSKNIAAAEVEDSTAVRVAHAWESLYNERNAMWRAAEDKIDAVRVLLENNGCDCPCEHHSEEHDDDCDRCLACMVSGALFPPRTRSSLR